MRIYFCAAVLLLAGCQCCEVTERYQDVVDCVADHEGCLDRWYHPELDLTRIGYPDWCQCGFNRWICGRACRCRQTRPDYAHAPVYVADCPQARPATVPPAELPEEGLVPVPTEALPRSGVPAQLEPIPDPPALNPFPRLPGDAAPPQIVPPPLDSSRRIDSPRRDQGVTPAGYEWMPLAPAKPAAAPRTTAPAESPATTAPAEPPATTAPTILQTSAIESVDAPVDDWQPPAQRSVARANYEQLDDRLAVLERVVLEQTSRQLDGPSQPQPFPDPATASRHANALPLIRPTQPSGRTGLAPPMTAGTAISAPTGVPESPLWKTRAR